MIEMKSAAVATEFKLAKEQKLTELPQYERGDPDIQIQLESMQASIAQLKMEGDSAVRKVASSLK